METMASLQSLDKPTLVERARRHSLSTAGTKATLVSRLYSRELDLRRKQFRSLMRNSKPALQARAEGLDLKRSGNKQDLADRINNALAILRTQKETDTDARWREGIEKGKEEIGPSSSSSLFSGGGGEKDTVGSGKNKPKLPLSVLPLSQLRVRGEAVAIPNASTMEADALIAALHAYGGGVEGREQLEKEVQFLCPWFPKFERFDVVWTRHLLRGDHPDMDAVRASAWVEYRLSWPCFLIEMPDEIGLYILQFLSPFDLAAVAQTCTWGWRMAQDNALWRPYLKERLGAYPPKVVAEFMASTRVPGVLFDWFVAKGEDGADRACDGCSRDQALPSTYPELTAVGALMCLNCSVSLMGDRVKTNLLHLWGLDPLDIPGRYLAKNGFDGEYVRKKAKTRHGSVLRALETGFANNTIHKKQWDTSYRARGPRAPPSVATIFIQRRSKALKVLHSVGFPAFPRWGPDTSRDPRDLQIMHDPTGPHQVVHQTHDLIPSPDSSASVGWHAESAALIERHIMTGDSALLESLRSSAPWVDISMVLTTRALFAPPHNLSQAEVDALFADPVLDSKAAAAACFLHTHNANAILGWPFAASILLQRNRRKQAVFEATWDPDLVDPLHENRVLSWIRCSTLDTEAAEKTSLFSLIKSINAGFERSRIRHQMNLLPYHERKTLFRKLAATYR